MICAIAALGVGLIWRAGRWALKRDKSPPVGVVEASPVLDQTGTSQWGWDGATISDYYLDESVFVL